MARIRQSKPDMARIRHSKPEYSTYKTVKARYGTYKTVKARLRGATAPEVLGDQRGPDVRHAHLPVPPPAGPVLSRCRVNMARIRQSKPDIRQSKPYKTVKVREATYKTVNAREETAPEVFGDQRGPDLRHAHLPVPLPAGPVPPNFPFISRCRGFDCLICAIFKALSVLYVPCSRL